MTRAHEAGVVPMWTQPDKLRKAREHAELNQGELASLMGVGRATVARAEQGTTTPRRPVILAWAMATGVSLDWLMEETPSPDGESAPSRTRTYDLRIKSP
ncbi:XRE family transcriptional regulator [Rhodococcus sp. 14-2686-1-2]|nr:XRE family transcriptional regulator [Rhodococcus sp. 15-1189-1-1a]OZF20437.1 XRE family transcriptional regulator [Rhodococcus sp. 14-2686-1-2]